MNEKIIELEHVDFRYKGSDGGLLNDISLSVKKGETLLLTGASGSGKTTIIRLINGLIPHYYQGELTGMVNVAGRDIASTELYDLAGVVGTVFQNPRSQFFSVDTDGELVFGPENIGLSPGEIRKRKASVELSMNLKDLLGRSIFELSGGEKQRIACASVAALLPEIILLDEPSSNLDFEAIGKLKKIIVDWKSQGKTIVISEHRLWYLKDLADCVICMENGHIGKEWSGEEFSGLSDAEIMFYKLRPTTVNACFTDLFQGRAAVGDFRQSEIDEGIELRDFFFAYSKKAYVLKKKKFSASDGDILDLNIPKLVLPKGKVIAVVGKNGTGKSTFLRCLCGLEKDCCAPLKS